MAKHLPSQERLKELLSYCPETGVFTWIEARGPRKAGAEAGKFDSRGYRSIKVDGGNYRACRLAWMYMHGVNPTGCIDHINHIKSDDRICNLRDVDLFGNMQNYTKPNANNVAGLLGVSTSRSKFSSEIRVRNARIHLGTFNTAQQAHEAYVNAKRKYHPTGIL